MTTIDHQQAAREAAAEALADDWNPDRDPVLTAMFRDYSATALTAAAPHLRAGIAEELKRELEKIGNGESQLFPTFDHKSTAFQAGIITGVARIIALLEGGGK
jgi:hypothetical protein